VRLPQAAVERDRLFQELLGAQQRLGRARLELLGTLHEQLHCALVGRRLDLVGGGLFGLLRPASREHHEQDTREHPLPSPPPEGEGSAFPPPPGEG
jgi:hypothetical protein